MKQEKWLEEEPETPPEKEEGKKPDFTARLTEREKDLLERLSPEDRQLWEERQEEEIAMGRVLARITGEDESVDPELLRNSFMNSIGQSILSNVDPTFDPNKEDFSWKKFQEKIDENPEIAEAIAPQKQELDPEELKRQEEIRKRRDKDSFRAYS
ncbi:MAG TPA: hypothetical protein VI432_01685 [Candidatus Paceibacterota bacterium]